MDGYDAARPVEETDDLASFKGLAGWGLVGVAFWLFVGWLVFD